MNPPEVAELDESRITTKARLFAADLFARFPELRRHAAMERRRGEEAWTLMVEAPAPSGDPRSRLVVWVEGGDDPSVAFGDWHTHENVWGDFDERGEPRSLLDLIAGILADRYILCVDVGAESATLLDLEQDDALADEMTSGYSSGRVRLRSWSGRHDGEVTLDDLERDGTT